MLIWQFHPWNRGTSYDWLNASEVSLRISEDNDVIKWKHFPRYWPFVRGIHRCPVNSPHKGQWRGALMFSLICARINGWVNNREAGDLRRHGAHHDVTVMRSSNESIMTSHMSKTKQSTSKLRVYFMRYIVRNKSHNAPVLYPTMHHCNKNVHMYAHSCNKMAYYWIFVQSIMGFVRRVYCSITARNDTMSASPQCSIRYRTRSIMQ